MEYKPHDYQKTAYDWVMNIPKCALFLDMGLGKTIVTLTALQELKDCLDAERILVIAPKRVAEDTWSREVEKWDHLSLTISKVLGNVKQRMAALAADADIYVINRENVAWLVKNHKWDFDTVVIDELSSFKSPSSQRFRALRSVMPKCQRVIGLTGTPAPNGYKDLWSEVYLLDQGKRLGKTVTEFKARYFIDIAYGQTYEDLRLKKGAKDTIDQLLKDLCMSMSADDYLKMPERIDNVLHVKLSTKEQELYREMERNQLATLEDGETIMSLSAAGVMNKLLQLSSGFMYDEDKQPHWIHERKLDALEEIIDCNEGESVLVFYSYQADRDAILKRFPKARVMNDSKDISDWNSQKAKLMIAHPASIGHGLNIQEGGHIIVWYGLPWSLELYQQANRRLHRQGQVSKHVIINHLIADGTVDEQVMRALNDKNITQAALMAALKARK